MRSILVQRRDVREDLLDRIDRLEHVFRNPVVPTASERSKGIPLKFDYDRTVEASLSTVWSVLTDPAAMKPHLPGTATVVSTGSDSYRVSIKIRMGFLRPTVNANVHLSNIDELRGFTIELSGKSMGAGVSTNAKMTLTGTGGDSGGTAIQMMGSVETSGMLKKVADSKIETAAVGFLESYFASIESDGSSN